MDFYDLDKSLDEFYRSLDDSVNNIFKDADNLLTDGTGNEAPSPIQQTDTPTEQEAQTMPGLVRDERLEDRTMSRIGTFEKIYNEIYESQTKSPITFGYADLDYSVLVTLLSSCLEIELNASIYKKIQQIRKNDPSYKATRDTDINYNQSTQTLGSFILIISKFEKELKPYLDDPRGFAKVLSKISTYRNNAAHTSATSKNQFLKFYQIFSWLFNSYIVKLMNLKASLKSSSFTYSTFGNPDFDQEEQEYLKKITGCQNLDRFTQKEPTTVDDQPEECRHAAGESRNGLIFTNCKQLAIKYFGSNSTSNPDVERQIVSHIKKRMEEYADACSEFGIHYSILDVSQFDPFLDKTQGWKAYLKLLDRYCDQHGISSEGTPWGLFIIGGDDVIPMPLVNNPTYTLPEEMESADEPNKDVDTDLFYSYRSDQIALDEKLNVDLNKLFTCNPRFLVGRLPLENDYMETRFEQDIENYFARSIDTYRKGGIHIKTFPLVTSCESSKKVAQYMTSNIPLMPVKPIWGYVENNIIISPPYAVSDAAADTFSQEAKYCLSNQLSADMLVFILHGSDLPTVHEYLGEAKNRQKHTIGFSADMFSACNAQCVAGICCFGAKYIGYRRSYSALLQAIYNRTLIFMGSSRSAYGYFDCHLDLPHASTPIFAAEVFMRYYLACLLSGICAAEALMKAKIMYIDYANRNKGTEKSQPAGLTLLEFNLYGDPFQKVIPIMQDYHIPDVKSNDREHEFSVRPQSNSIMSGNELKINGIVDCLSEKRTYSTLYCSEHAPSQGTGNEVRELVDQNFKMIHNLFTKNLYNELGVPPRELYSMQKYTSSTGQEGYSLLYRHKESQLMQETIVELDMEGNIQSAIGSF